MRMQYKIESRPAQEFGYEVAIAKLLDIVPTISNNSDLEFMVPSNEDLDESRLDQFHLGFTEKRGNLLRLSALIDIDCRMTIGCAGAVVTYLGRRRAIHSAFHAAGEAAPLRVSALRTFTLENTM